MMLIQTNQLIKIYGSGENALRALDGVNLSVERGEFVSVVGSSGSGKSTLLHLLGGIDVPTEGTVTIDGTDLYSLSPDPLTIFRRRYIGFVFQSYNLIPGLNVWENIVLPIGLDKLKAGREEIEQLLSTLGIYEKRYSMPSQLSGGQQQRVAIARALATKPHIILADEPTGNLDSKTSLEVMLLLEKLNREFSQTILMITHNEELAQMTSRRIRIEDGRIVSDSGEVAG
ncbi:ABC transporter ATP-binding protein [Acutalibacter sp. 1XD8-36]|uniref:ABC transporter ATP-binding protein n=1 Tax=Acutalibacter sp. 1XD8-36 TaxID=2320852 RepID=UPI0014133F3B|nr:ABC transporter ATP-binding protein [Acutalibacter sp. 1XD8-36]